MVGWRTAAAAAIALALVGGSIPDDTLLRAPGDSKALLRGSDEGAVIITTGSGETRHRAGSVRRRRELSKPRDAPSIKVISPEERPQQQQHALLVVAVPSIRPDRRQAIRNAWLAWADERVVLRFFTDAPDLSEPHGPEAAALLEKEMLASGDLVLMNIKSGMNFGLKLLWTMRWMAEHYTFDFYLRLDDDYFLCLERLLNELAVMRDATAPEKLPPQEKPYIYAGKLWCEKDHCRNDESYLLLSGALVQRVLDTPDLLCGGHGGTTAGYWFTRGSNVNPDGDVAWYHDPRLPMYEGVWSRRAKDPPPLSAVCERYMGVHHSYVEQIGGLWDALSKAAATGTLSGAVPSISLIEGMDDSHCPKAMESGTSKAWMERDNAQLCDSFEGSESKYCGRQGGC